MPKPINYICTKCSFCDSSYSTWGDHLYVIKDECIPIHRKIGICYKCDSIVSVEDLDKQISFFSKKSKSLDDKRLTLLKNRKSKPRCLNCGSHNFEVIPAIEPNQDRLRSGTPVRTGIFHRKCGGRIYADFTAPNFFMGDNLPKRYFDLEGREITVP